MCVHDARSFSEAMELEIRGYTSADIREVWSWVPNPGQPVFFQLTLEIGEVGQRGSYFFQLVVATPEGVRDFATRFPGCELPDRALLVFADYTWDRLADKLTSILAKCARPEWGDTLVCMQRYFEWEYEDYRSAEAALPEA